MESIFPSVLNWVLSVDRELFLLINNQLSSHAFDLIMPIITDLHRQPIFWGAVVLFMIYSIFRPAPKASAARTPLLDSDLRKSRIARWGKGMLVLGLAMGLSDLVAYRGMKVYVQRERPEAAGVSTILRTHSHSGWSFPSNHAANTFALARTIQIIAPPYAFPAYIFAALVAFSRVYVGVHFPLDVTAGALIGFLSASLIAGIGRRLKNVGYFSRARK